MAVLNQLLIFMIEFNQTEKERIALSHDSKFRNPVTITSLEKFRSLTGKSLNNQDLMFQSRNVETVNHQVAVIVI